MNRIAHAFGRLFPMEPFSTPEPLGTKEELWSREWTPELLGLTRHTVMRKRKELWSGECNGTFSTTESYRAFPFVLVKQNA